MDREMLHRIKTAAEYQKKAFRALLPDKMEKHLDVIEREVKILLAEAAAEVLKEYKGKDDPQDKDTSAPMRKVTIE